MISYYSEVGTRRKPRGGRWSASRSEEVHLAWRPFLEGDPGIEDAEEHNFVLVVSHAGVLDGEEKAVAMHKHPPGHERGQRGQQAASPAQPRPSVRQGMQQQQ